MIRVLQLFWIASSFCWATIAFASFSPSVLRLREDSVVWSSWIDEKIASLIESEKFGRELIREFDEALAQGLNPMDTLAYARLVVLREVDDDLTGSLIALYESVLERAKRGEADAVLARDLVEARFAQIAHATHAESDLQRMALQNVAWEMMDSGLEIPVAMTQIASQGIPKLVQESTYRVNPDHELFRFIVAEGGATRSKMDAQNKKTIEPSSQANGSISGREAGLKAGTWALTFDDGPHLLRTPNILNALQKRGLKATFFQLGSLVQRYSALALQMRDAKMELANHSWSHLNLSKATEAQLQEEIIHSTEVELQILGQSPKYFRNPYGAGAAAGSPARKMVAKNGMIHVAWNVDSLDWKDKDPSSVANRVIEAMKLEKKGIVLFHDIQPHTSQASAKVMDWLLANKKNVVLISKIVEQLNAPKN